MRSLEDLSRAELATLGREYMLFGHLLNRAALPHVHLQIGAEAREAIAIDEWMGASPVYTQRMQRCMGFGGDDVETIFKGFQLDVGFPHQYMHVCYQLESPTRGFFWLPHCGALLEVEQYGEGAVRSMCHNIEDPTFDASAVATNPRARVRPIHRPPRVPADRSPHCHWEVFIDPGAEPVTEAAITTRVRPSRLAAFEFPAAPSDASGGRDDYAGAFEPDFRLEHLSRAALVRACREFLVQDHLLIRALMIAISERADDDAAQRIAALQWTGAGAVAAGRIRRALTMDGDGIEAIGALLALHPAFVPGYAPLAVDGARLSIADCEALREGDAYSWLALLSDAPHPGLDAMVQAVNPTARCVPVPPRGGERIAWEVRFDAPAVETPMEIAMVANTNTAGFVFR
ncbi:MAG: hypothetical protein SF182_20110 [Deltaproteobacteria bacterium]|nr:hypothetical protein [Deltaproteobacteria bacterium]